MSITDRARAEAERRGRDYTGDGREGEAYEDGFTTGARWAASRPVTDAEVLAALNAQGPVMDPKLLPAPSLDYWGDKPVEAMRAALTAARETQPVTDAEVEAAARVLNLAGWTCQGGAHEPGGYDDCEDCRRAARDRARQALTAAREAQR